MSLKHPEEQGVLLCYNSADLVLSLRPRSLKSFPIPSGIQMSATDNNGLLGLMFNLASSRVAGCQYCQIQNEKIRAENRIKLEDNDSFRTE